MLLSIKESYLFSRNVFGLYKHPFKTLRALFREQDYSQEILILGLPLIVFFMGIMVIKLGRLIIGAPPEWGFLANFLLILLILLILLVSFYLIYWLVQIIKRRFPW